MTKRNPGVVLVLFLVCGAAADLAGQSGGILEEVATNLPRTVDIQTAGDGSGRLFLVQQDGIIRILEDGSPLPRAFLDINGRVASGGERGLLGLAFPANSAGQGYFYVNYTGLSGATVVSRFDVSPDPNVADTASETILLTVPQPFGNHNGGQIRFGPDGYLYIGMGDGGSANDPMNNAQNPQSLLGKMLRIDVEPDLDEYRVPPDNPFVGETDFRPEIWALGLRNPWRFSFDRATGDLWIGDVGQGRAEEIDFQPAASTGGENYGWRQMEGILCRQANCDPQDFTPPVLEYPRDQGQSVTGGIVYRGSLYPQARGTYVYGDFVSGRIWTLRREEDSFVNQSLVRSAGNIATFGEDEAGELYAAYYGGTIFHLNLGGLAPQTPVVVDGASFEPGVVAGSAATVFLPGLLDHEGVVGAEDLPLPGSINGVEVLLDGVPAALYSLANSGGVEQANFQAPFSIAGRSRVAVTIRRAGVFEAQGEVTILGARPAVFTASGEAIVVHHSSNRLVAETEPLQPGEFAYFYATGIGPVDNPPSTGAAAPIGELVTARTLPEVTIGGSRCAVTFAGLAPGFVGVYQINIEVAGTVPSGVQPMVVTVDGVSSPEVLVWIR